MDLSAYQTKTNRRRLTGAYSAKSPLAAVIALTGEAEVVLFSASGRALSVKSSLLSSKPTRDSQGVQVMKLKKGDTVASARLLSGTSIKEPGRYRSRTLPALGAVLRPQDAGDPSFLPE